MQLPPQPSLDDGLRKAALLVAGLDRASADAVLAALGPDASQQVRQAVLELDRVDPAEQQRAVEEFLGTAPRPKRSATAGVELDEGLARRLGIQPRNRPPAERPQPGPQPGPPAGPPFRFLHEAETEELANLLAGERPQTIAVVLAHLPANGAAGVLGRLDEEVQVDVLRRLADLEETDPEILRELEHALQARFSRDMGIRPRRAAGLDAIGDIVRAADVSLGSQILENLAQHDPKLVERLGPPPIDFDDLGLLDESDLRRLMAELDDALLSMALIGSAPGLASRLLGVLSEHEAAEIRRQIDQPGPIQLRDLEEARRQIADRAWCLAVQGQLRLPDGSRQIAA